jgi:chemotaxis protein MotB
VLGGASPSEDGAKSAGAAAFVMKAQPPSPEETAAKKKQAEKEAAAGALKGAQDSKQSRAFDAAASRLRQALQSLPELTELSKHVIIDETDEGMRIQLIDHDERSMFKAGDSEPTPRIERLPEVANTISALPNRIAISGHTDGKPFSGPGGYSNWELSSARANAARRILEEHNIAPGRLAQVTGRAGADPLYPDNPYASANRRIGIVLLREAPVLPPDFQP